MKQGEKLGQFGESQHGSRKFCKANNAVLPKLLTYDLSRILRSNLGTFDSDAKSCYNCIISSLAMLPERRLGMPRTAVTTHAGVLEAMKYVVKTHFWTYTQYIQSLLFQFLFGTGQGSGASPVVWLTISLILLSSRRILVDRGLQSSSPSEELIVERHSDAFVDDTQNG